MSTDELDLLEGQLRAVSGRLAASRRFDTLAPRVRRALWRPVWALAWTMGLIAISVVAGFWAPGTWLVAGGLLLAVLPDRVRAVRVRRRAVAAASEGDLFELCAAELRLERAEHVMQALLGGALALLFALVAILAPDPRPGGLVAGLLVVLAAVRLLWRLPRTQRALSDLEGSEAG